MSEPTDSGSGSSAENAEAENSSSSSGDEASQAEPSMEEIVGEELTLSVEDLVADLEKVTAERDDYLDRLLRLQAEFENYRKAVVKREADAKERANDKIVGELLTVIDACDGAVANGSEDVIPVRNAIVETLAKQGLERLEPTDAPFDPEQHDAVMHEPADDVDGPVVAEVLRVGYGWNGRVIRPAMVRVKG